MTERVYRATTVLGRGVVRLLGLDTRWTGLEHVPVDGPVVLAATHVSYPDFLMIEQAALERSRHVRFLCRHDVWHLPIVRTAMDRMQHVPVDREAPAAAYLQARRLLREGEAVGAFPEAGVSWTHTVRSLMPGVASLARETGAPVVPVAIWGSQRLWTVGLPDARGRGPQQGWQPLPGARGPAGVRMVDPAGAPPDDHHRLHRQPAQVTRRTRAGRPLPGLSARPAVRTADVRDARRPPGEAPAPGRGTAPGRPARGPTTAGRDRLRGATDERDSTAPAPWSKERAWQ